MGHLEVAIETLYSRVLGVLDFFQSNVFTIFVQESLLFLKNYYYYYFEFREEKILL